jgi:hypothetical protein
MREIKFRFWLGHIKKMTFPHTLQEVSRIIPDFTEDIIPLQFTGLFDKNGKEIYEGDLLIHMGKVYKIMFLDGFFVGVSNSLTHWSKYAKDLSNGEIIGNIYQNPELFK